ncbi:hypothetical protein PVAP13_2NG062146 [Panicum virgatum]|uniref:Uncharacterized protein n=1 Tax=Panicum virgatum TaxID=38727 RepID=A0A8T0VEU5_PANVG|nr:hypothetical protein PVAP13_2NG062146 [Panicum virgatum]
MRRHSPPSLPPAALASHPLARRRRTRASTEQNSGATVAAGHARAGGERPRQVHARAGKRPRPSSISGRRRASWRRTPSSPPPPPSTPRQHGGGLAAERPRRGGSSGAARWGSGGRGALRRRSNGRRQSVHGRRSTTATLPPPSSVSGRRWASRAWMRTAGRRPGAGGGREERPQAGPTPRTGRPLSRLICRA